MCGSSSGRKIALLSVRVGARHLAARNVGSSGWRSALHPGDPRALVQGRATGGASSDAPTDPSRILNGLRFSYAQEFDALSRTYADVRDCVLSDLRAAVARQGSGPASFIASGGMFAVATLAAQLHERACLQPGTPLTPLAAINRPVLTTNAAMLFSSSGKHPDAHEVMRRLGRPGMRPAAVVTHRAADELPHMPEASVITLPALSVREGFLAVNSIISMSVALIRAYLGDEALERSLPSFGDEQPLPDSLDRLLVLHPPSLAAVAVDIETRLVEIGLAAVQLADYRNFAHGRHTGLQRNLPQTTILALSDKGSAELANATLAVLPTSAAIVHWHTPAPWPAGVLALLMESMRACGQLGTANRVNVARPQVPEFGRKLYRLAVRKRLPETLLGPVERKLAGIGGSGAEHDAHGDYHRWLAQWSQEISERRFAAVVLDYDGTVCHTEERFDPPAPRVVAALDRLLSRGLRLGFASGRGPSLHSALRACLDPAHWQRVELGLYNGGVLCRLDEQLGDLSEPTGVILDVQERLRALPIAASLRLEARCVQLTVQLKDGVWMKAGLLAELVGGACAQAPALAVKVFSSGHSVDVVPLATSKSAVVQRIRHRDGPVDVLCIGDQGQIAGNDFELLAGERWSLSVDRTSADPTRCWYLGDGSASGPTLLVRYLAALGGRGSSAMLKTRELL